MITTARELIERLQRFDLDSLLVVHIAGHDAAVEHVSTDGGSYTVLHAEFTRPDPPYQPSDPGFVENVVDWAAEQVEQAKGQPRIAAQSVSGHKQNPAR